jgi:GntR family transcriptional regulator/MocR family aminotransferase
MNASGSTKRRKLVPQVLLRIDSSSDLNLQRQIRQQLVDAIASGGFVSGRRLPSSRQLARQLGVARNTVVLACQQLIAEGHLLARERSGLYVNDEIVKGLALSVRVVNPAADAASNLDWSARIKTPAAAADGWRFPPDWQKYPFPFVEGRFDRSLYPIVEWREATRLALGVRQVEEWSTDTGDADDPKLVQEICGKVLPRRGIRARPDQVLLTGGAQEALHLLTELLVERDTKVGVEEPGNIAMLQLLGRRGAELVHLPVDENGLVVGSGLDDCEILYVTPSHQRPTAATLSMARRAELLAKARARDSVIIEDDFECETNYLDDAYPALRSLAGGERVIYVADLSRALAPGLRLGFIVASPEIVAEARALRALTSRQPPLSVQRTAALFFSLGHYDKTMLRLGRVFRERMIALRDALNHYLPQSIAIAPVRGGTTFWVRGPEGLDARDLARSAETRGVLIEPVSHYYAGTAAPANVFRMSVTGIAEGKIRQGVATLAELIREMSAGKWLDPRKSKWLGPRELRKLIPGATFLYKTVYGEPCTIELQRNGEMVGRAGYANEDHDRGRWWIEDGLWCRQWQTWAYGEVSKYRTHIEGDRIQWFNAQGRLIDSAIFVRAGQEPAKVVSG